MDVMDDLKKFLDAVAAMRAAQKLEMDALPSNLNIWKRARQRQTVARLEERVDALVQELQRAPDLTADASEGAAQPKPIRA
jgi:uncharacterized coiled-coil protein SlyX